MNARLLTDYFGSLEKGKFVNDASVEFNELVARCMGTGKAGSFTITLSVKPNTGIDSETVSIVGRANAKLPELPRGVTLFFVDNDFNLSRRDPRQYELEDRVRDVTAEAAPSAQTATAAE